MHKTLTAPTGAATASFMSQTDTAPPRPRTNLYLITPPHLADEVAFIASLKEVLETGLVTALQIRLKAADRTSLDKAATRRLANAIIPSAQAAGTAVFINDDAALAVELGADGVHLGRSDMPVKAARALLQDTMIIGATCHDSRHAAMQAGEDGADYVAFGAFYPTTTKDAPTRAEPDILEWWQELFELPCVAIGGITLENAAPLIQAGADFIAVSAGVWQYPEGPVAAIKAFDALLTAEHARFTSILQATI